MTREFILDTLLPYKENRELCGYINNGRNQDSCVYLTEDGKKCAVGKYMKDGPWQKIFGNYECVIEKYKPEEFFTQEALDQNISTDVWMLMQAYHDDIASNFPNKIINPGVQDLELATNFDLSPLKFEI